jgi:hypothetical protein
MLMLLCLTFLPVVLGLYTVSTSTSSTILVQDDKHPRDKIEPGQHNCCSSWQGLKNSLQSHPIHLLPTLLLSRSSLNSNKIHVRIQLSNPCPTKLN